MAVQSFVKRFGTHNIRGVTMGGRLRQRTILSTDSCWTETVKKKAEEVDGSFRASMDDKTEFGVKTEFGQSDSKAAEIDNKASKESRSWSSVGGNPALVEEGGDGLCAGEWRVSTRQFAAPMRFQLRSMDLEVYEAARGLGDSEDVAFQKSEAVSKYSEI